MSQTVTEELRCRVEDLRISLPARGVDVVDHVDLTLKAGEILGLVGESGSGRAPPRARPCSAMPAPEPPSPAATSKWPGTGCVNSDLPRCAPSAGSRSAMCHRIPARR